MHEVLGAFVSRNFYGGKLRSPRGSTGFEHGLARYGSAVAAWVDVPQDKGPEYRVRSTHRPAEADWIAAELPSLMTQAPALTFGVISFYADQVETVGVKLEKEGIAQRAGQGEDHFIGAAEFQLTSDGQDRLRVGSVDSFQGRQFDVVLLSTTRSAPDSYAMRPDEPAAYAKWVRRRYGHLLLINRLCVAMSRQRRLLIVVGDAAMFDPPRAPGEAAPLTDFLRTCRAGGEHGRFLRG
jgi:superfamily I DNA and/or RNA helicase